MSTLHAFDFLDEPTTTVPAIVAVFGGETFLKRLTLQRIRASVLEDDSEPFDVFDATAQWRDVVDELSTKSLFGGSRRLVIVQNADAWVTRERARLEKYAEHPRSSGVLVLDVDSWAANTRLYKALDKTGLQVECRPPEKTVGRRKVFDPSRMAKWLTAWTKQAHDAVLEPRAVDTLLELVGPEMGLLDQDLAKLALFAGPGGKITPDMVRDIVGGWRSKTIWELVDAAADGDAAEALRQLDHLLRSGEHPVALFGQISWSLRRFAAATRVYQEMEQAGRRGSLRDALIEAGIPHWNQKGLERAESQLKQLGRERAGQLFHWLLEADLALKGTHSSPDRARFALERLLLRMAAVLNRRPARPV